ncbi:MAG TPA: hypothetical protein VEA99_08950 [Gemmatimonadaceae bacterium]|nr:hypothetical protein [Gemmatimonadaceae bacterium]
MRPLASRHSIGQRMLDRRRLLVLALPLLAACGAVDETVAPASLLAAPASVAAHDGYALVELPIPGGVGGAANDINARGQIVGSILSASGDERAALWDQGATHDLGTLPGDWLSVALGINEAGTIVGYSYGPSGIRAVSWRQQVIAPLDVSPSAGFAAAVAIASRGTVVGDGWDDTFANHAFAWNRGAATFLGSSAVDDASAAVGVNARGDVVGWVLNGGTSYATAWRNGARELLPQRPGHLRSQAYGINAAGQVVGASGTVGPDYELATRAVLWDKGQAIDLGTPGGAEASASAISEPGAVVGQGLTASGEVVAWIWEGGVMSTLPIPPGGAAIASSINHHGDVVGRLDRGFGSVPVVWRRARP